MARIKVQLNLPGLNALMRSKPVQDRVNDIGAEMAADAGEGFEYVPSTHRYTARGYVQVNSLDGARRQARDAVLERVMGSRR